VGEKENLVRHYIILLAVLTVSCQTGELAAPRHSDVAERAAVGSPYSQVTLKAESPYPTVGIGTYTLITHDPDAHRRDAEAIMRVKIEWPRAMQTKEQAAFDRILARGFTFRGEAEFYGREDYIRDRVGNNVEVASAQYENLVLQFFGEVAVLTYRNTVRIKDESGNPQTLRMCWADTFVKEVGEWKIGGSHLIELRAEKG
jgi:ketosteroid isomerase-like protein